MQSGLFPCNDVRFTDHPKYLNVRIALLVSGKESDRVSVCMLEIATNTEIPAHVHDTQADSIFVAAGEGQALVNGAWRPIEVGDYIFVPPGDEHGARNTGSTPMLLFIHHSPPFSDFP